eukprot:TRINITY_DN25166_c0_g1_i1.p1 TRINITY_DN25166_c0_g1~~TRINITY_DN25166_c0_g1_i1.p1  ORF type:complete len:1070 (+),score=155.62 TRINITY_DN25166_c0_g1_i1:305-3514(+)
MVDPHRSGGEPEVQAHLEDVELGLNHGTRDNRVGRRAKEARRMSADISQRGGSRRGHGRERVERNQKPPGRRRSSSESSPHKDQNQRTSENATAARLLGRESADHDVRSESSVDTFVCPGLDSWHADSLALLVHTGSPGTGSPALSPGISSPDGSLLARRALLPPPPLWSHVGRHACSPSDDHTHHHHSGQPELQTTGFHALFEDHLQSPFSAGAPTSACSAGQPSGFFSFTPGAADGLVATVSLKQAVLHQGLHDVKALLRQRADPNEKLGAFNCGNGHFTAGTPLAVAVMRGRLDLVRLLVGYGADLESQYEFTAGSLSLPWSGSALFAAIPAGNAAIMKELLTMAANVDTRSSNGANALWQTCYFGQEKLLNELLFRKPELDVAVQSHDNPRVSHTALHVASRKGFTTIVSRLLHVRASVQVTNELGVSPLDDAIIRGHAAIVRILVSNKADLLTVGKLRTSVGGRPYRRRIDLLFAFQDRSVIAAAAQGLQDAPVQVAKSLHKADLIKFLGTPGDAPSELLTALFRCRSLQYYDAELKERSKIESAYMRRTSLFAEVPNLLAGAALGPRCGGLVHALSEQRRSSYARAFLRRLAPQLPQSEADALAIVTVFQALLPDLHADLDVLMSLATSPDEKIFGEVAAQAVLTVAWSRTVVYWVVLLCFDVGYLCMLLVATLVMHGPAAWDWSIESWAQATAVLWLLEAAVSWSMLHGYTAADLWQQWKQRPNSWLSIANPLLLLVALLVVAIEGHESIQSAAFRGLVSFALLARWMRTMATLAVGVETVGVHLVPVMSALGDVANTGGILVASIAVVFAIIQGLVVVDAAAAFSRMADNLESNSRASNRGGDTVAFVFMGFAALIAGLLLYLLSSTTAARYEYFKKHAHAEFMRRRASLIADCAACTRAWQWLIVLIPRARQHLASNGATDDPEKATDVQSPTAASEASYHHTDDDRYVWFSRRVQADDSLGTAAAARTSPEDAWIDIQADVSRLRQEVAQQRAELSRGLRGILAPTQAAQRHLQAEASSVVGSVTAPTPTHLPGGLPPNPSSRPWPGRSPPGGPQLAAY